MASNESAEMTHQDPVWRDRGDFIIGATVPNAERPTEEQLWARQLTGSTFELCCIPFFLYDLALGDVLETDADYLVSRVVSRSGRFAFRVWFGDGDHPRFEVTSELADLGALLEWSSENLLAVDASDRAHADRVADVLLRHETAGHLVYETAQSV